MRLGRTFIALSLAALVGSLGGCATPVPDPDEPVVTSDGLVRIERAGPGVLLVRPDHSLGSYDDVLFKRIHIAYARGQHPLNDRDRARIIDTVLETATFGRGQGDIERVKSPGPCVLEMTLHLLDVQLRESVRSGSQSSYVSSFGTVTLVLELNDSETGRRLASYAERRSLGGGPDVGNTGVDARRFGKTMSSMTDNMVDALYDIVPGTTEMREHECRGNIAAYAETRATQ